MKLPDIVFYNKGVGPGDGNNYWRRVTGPHYIYMGITLFLMSVGVGLVSLFTCSSFLGGNGYGMFLSYLQCPLILILNLVPCLLLASFFYFATGRAWAAFTFPALIVYALSLINFYKVRLRSEVLAASDIQFFTAAAGIASRYTFEITGRVVLVAASFVLGTLFAVFFMRGKLKNRIVRLVGAILSLAVFVTLLFTVYFDKQLYFETVNDKAVYSVWSDFQVYISKGFLYPLLHTVPDAVPKPPEGYDESEAENILASRVEGSIPADRRVNVISVMCEAFADLTELGVRAAPEVYAPLHRMQAESVSGHVISNVFAGGTIDTERNFLTGYPQSDEYRAATNSYIYYLRQQGYRAEGFHTGDAWFYNRKNVQMNLGMQGYYFLEDYGTQNRTDEFFFSTVKELYESRDKSVPYFSFSVTYQNHGPYFTDFSEKELTEYEDISEYSRNVLNNYFTGIMDTAERIEALADSLRKAPEPVVLLIFGDHMPWLGDANSVYVELGIDIDVGSEEGFYNYYSVPYIIWANDAAKTVLGNDFTGDGGDVSSCFLMDRLFEECGWGKPAYMQLVHDVYERADIINTGSGWYRVAGQLTKEPDAETSELLRKLAMAEYYMKHKFLYKGLYGGSQ